MEFSNEALIGSLLLAAGGELTISTDMLDKVVGKEIELIDNEDGTLTLRIL